MNTIGIQVDIVGMFRELTIDWTGRKSGYIMKTRALFMMILHRLSEILLYKIDSAQWDYRVSRIIRYITEHYSERLTVRQLAEMVKLDAGYFGALFKQETGLTMHQFLTRIRINNAEDMLRTGSFKIHEAAQQCGFSDPFHFYKSFRSLRGFAPSQCIPKGGRDMMNEDGSLRNAPDQV